MKELWDAYKPDGSLSGDVLVRGEPIPAEYRHGVTEVLVLHQDGSILVMQRDFKKPSKPGMWEASAGGSVLKGETFSDGAKRELLEETGISRGTWKFLYRNITSSTIYDGFLCITDQAKDTIQLQEGETIDYRWTTPEELRILMQTGQCASNTRGQLDAVLQDISTGKLP